MAGLGALCVLVVVVLGLAVLSLRRDVRRLTGQLSELQDGAAAPTTRVHSAAATASYASPPTASADERAAQDRAAEIPVITAIAADDDVDLTTARVASVTLARPLIKVAAFSHGLRRALGDEQRMRIRYTMRQEIKRQRKMRRRRKAARAPSEGWRP